MTLLDARVAARRLLSGAVILLQVLWVGHRDRLLWVVADLQVLRLTQEVSDIHSGKLQASLLPKVYVMSTPLVVKP